MLAASEQAPSLNNLAVAAEDVAADKTSAHNQKAEANGTTVDRDTTTIGDGEALEADETLD